MKKEADNKPVLFVIFGATGDLAKRKLVPALQNLHKKKLLPKKFGVLGFARRQLSDERFRKQFRNSRNNWTAFSKNLFYTQGNFTKDEDYARLAERIKKIKQRLGACNIVYYLATPPSFFGNIAEKLKKHGLARESENCWRRVVFEKPFGHDLKSARKLNKQIRTVFREDQTYRIDHYLGKELVQNIMVVRFANSIFETLLNNKNVDHVQISVLEKLGVEGREEYYDKTGALKDMIQSHLLQVLALTAMEPPASLNADDVRKEKIKVLQALTLPKNINECAVRGQYGPGRINNKKIKGYEEEISRRSSTETFAAIKIGVHNLRWGNVPFYLRTGKRLDKTLAEVHVVFKQLPCVLFCKLPKAQTPPNTLTIRIQPKAGVSVRFNAKLPEMLQVQPRIMEYCYECEFGPTPEAYERLLLDVIRGDSTLFTSWKEIELSWLFVDMIERAWKKQKPKFPNYAAGSSGPKEADKLMQKDHREWLCL